MTKQAKQTNESQIISAYVRRCNVIGVALPTAFVKRISDTTAESVSWNDLLKMRNIAERNKDTELLALVQRYKEEVMGW